jgi:hypothetical protein
MIAMKYSRKITTSILDIILGPVVNLKHDVEEIGFCFRLQIKPTHLGTVGSI